jgi:hypothetical protein
MFRVIGSRERVRVASTVGGKKKEKGERDMKAQTLVTNRKDGKETKAQNEGEK